MTATGTVVRAAVTARAGAETTTRTAIVTTFRSAAGAGVKIVAVGLVSLLMAACSAPAPPRVQASTAATTACAPPAGPPRAETATTIDVIEQAYLCILGNHHGGATLDARTLLTAAFAALTRELDRNGHNVPRASMPALTGDRTTDWAAFEATYRTITDHLPDQTTDQGSDRGSGLRDKLATATLEALVAALDDNHARWMHDLARPPDLYDGDDYGLGLQTNITTPQGTGDSSATGAALPPLFVTTVHGGAARAAALRPGDIIESINGSAPFIDHHATPALAALSPRYPEARPVRLRLLRQSTGRRWSATLTPGVFQRDPATLKVVRSHLIGDDIAYVRIAGFTPDAANRTFTALTRLRTGRTLTGLVLDLRGNDGGSPQEAIRLLSAFARDAATAYQCTADGTCRPLRTDDTVAPLNLPLTVLTDHGCASACEHFASAVKDLRLGTLIGTRTAGLVSGPARPYRLSDNTTVSLPTTHHLGPNREVIDRIGIPPDHHTPLTPHDAATGHDPALAKALTLLRT
ncbi:S41 family peptidase [Streptosporangium sp. DT93]|uniref:S41 family peptidase n=1 Tax=Streptosporangium sp. DT93 TaxID=3393428 RepID=UPI003CFBA1F4